MPMTKDEIARVLVESVVQTPNTGEPNSYLNGAMTSLREALGFRQNSQLHVCTWSDLCVKRPNRLKYHVPAPEKHIGQNITKTRDSGGAFAGRPPESPDLGDGSLVRVRVIDYLYGLFCAPGAPLRAIGDMLDQLDVQFRPLYRVTLSCDFFCVRPLEELGFHKDSTGNTLFVGLHYNNTDKLVGPEYLYDFWPRWKARDEDERFSPHTVGKREFDKGMTFWPQALREAVEVARTQLELQHGNDQDLVHVAKMDPLGLISIVDELVYHQTPLTRSRKDGDDYGGFLARLSPKLRNVKDKPQLRRQFSLDNMEDFWKDLGKGGQKYRSFIRHWVMIEPVAWHKFVD
jgi:hypothetical protein